MNSDTIFYKHPHKQVSFYVYVLFAISYIFYLRFAQYLSALLLEMAEERKCLHEVRTISCNFSKFCLVFLPLFDVILLILCFKEVSCFILQDNQTTKKVKFIIDAAYDDNDGDDDDDESDASVLFDTVCSICDNGGELLWYAHNFYSFKLCIHKDLSLREKY